MRRAIGSMLAAASLLLAVPSAALALTTPAVRLSDPQAFAASVYTTAFTTGPAGALTPGSTITITAPTGTDFFLDSLLYHVSSGGLTLPVAGINVQSAGGPFTNNQAVLMLGQSIPAGSPVTVTIAGVTNPGPATGDQLTISTSAEPAVVSSSAYRVDGVGQASWGTYTNAAGTRSYMLYQPPNASQTGALIVDLPGCEETAATEARWSRFPQVAAELGFSVLFPEQTTSANSIECWNWPETPDQQRGQQEPSIIAGMTQQIAQQIGANPSRIYVTGISAGGAMADIMAVTYPDIYAAAGVYAGCEYTGFPCFGAPAAQPPIVSAQSAIAQMGPRLRVVPVIVIGGDADELVSPVNEAYVVQQWLAVDAAAMGGTPSAVPQLPSSSATYDQPGKQTAMVYDWNSGARTLVEQIVVHGMAHQWSDAADGGTPEDAAITDPSGPDVTTRIAQFLLGSSGP